MSYGYGPPQQYLAHPPAYAYPTRRSAPPGVHVVAILQYIGGALSLVAAAVYGAVALGAGFSLPTSDNLDEPQLTGLGVITGVIAGVIAVFALIGIVLGRKLQVGRQWARVLVLLLCGLSVLATLGSFALTLATTGGRPGPAELPALAGLAYPVLCLVLLNTRAARSWFRSHTW